MKKWMLIFLSFVSIQLYSQQLTNFSLENVLNGETVSPSSFPSCDGLVIIFTSNNCPYDDYYRARIINLSHTYSAKVPFLLVNSGPDATDNKEAMKKKAAQSNIAIPYLADKDQTLMTSLDAHKTPEVFLLKNNGGKFVVIYRGAFDDNAQVESDVKQTYLKNAIDNMLSNKKSDTSEVRPAGCNLKKKS